MLVKTLEIDKLLTAYLPLLLGGSLVNYLVLKIVSASHSFQGEFIRIISPIKTA